jgi:hypothetical protein
MTMKLNRFIVIVLIISTSFSTLAQPLQDTTVVNKRRLNTFIIGSSIAYGATLIGLNELWYKDSQRQSFQFFNDNAEWKQVDKIGHVYSGFYFSYGLSRALRWCDVKPRKADLTAALTGFLVMVPIEIMDGYSDAYGASGGDLVANAAGSLLFAGQSLLWNEVRLYPKFSFRQTSFAPLRPNVLGDGFASEFFKDYNGQTYWLSVDMDKFMSFPKWLNFAVGYGADGMIYARDAQNAEAGYQPHRQYYFAIDFDDIDFLCKHDQDPGANCGILDPRHSLPWIFLLIIQKKDC